MNAGQMQEYRELAERLSFFGLEGQAQDAITALLMHVAALTVERDALAQQLQQAQDAAKRQAAYISACVDSDGCYRP